MSSSRSDPFSSSRSVSSRSWRCHHVQEVWSCAGQVCVIWCGCGHVDGREWQVVSGHVWCGGGGMACTRVRVCAYLLSRLVTTTWLLEDVPLLRSVTPSIPLYYCRGNMSYFLSNVN